MFVEKNFFLIGIFLVSLVGLTLYRKQLLIILLSFEISSLSIFMMFFVMLMSFNHFLTSAFYMLVVFVCEASLGLSMLVMLTRNKGDDYMKIE